MSTGFEVGILDSCIKDADLCVFANLGADTGTEGNVPSGKMLEYRYGYLTFRTLHITIS